MSKAVWPGFMVDTNPSIEIPQEEQVLVLWDCADGHVELLIELVFGLGGRAECWGINAQQIGWSAAGG